LLYQPNYGEGIQDVAHTERYPTKKHSLNVAYPWIN
jgi:hypothetical protein